MRRTTAHASLSKSPMLIHRGRKAMTNRTIHYQHPHWICGVVILVLLVWHATIAYAQRLTFTILTINDVYEIAPIRHRGGLAELATLLKGERATAPYHLTTVNGDFLSPSLMSGLFQGG